MQQQQLKRKPLLEHRRRRSRISARRIASRSIACTPAPSSAPRRRCSAGSVSRLPPSPLPPTKRETKHTYIHVRACVRLSLLRSPPPREKIYCGMTGAENVPAAPPSRLLPGSPFGTPMPTPTPTPTAAAPSSPPTRLVLKFSEKGGEDVYNSIAYAIKQKVWETDADADGSREGGNSSSTTTTAATSTSTSTSASQEPPKSEVGYASSALI